MTRLNLILMLLAGVILFGCESAFAQTTKPGDFSRTLTFGDRERTYLAHVPPKYDATTPTPGVLALHGAAMNGPMMVWFSGLNATSDAGNFIVVYPSGTGAGTFLTWNAGGFVGKFAEGRPDDVGFLRKMLDDLETVAHVDPKRIFACGMSNGGMMCYRLAADMSDRIAAIAPVGGTISLAESHPLRPVPVIHFHGTTDPLVPFDGIQGKPPTYMRFDSVPESIETWIKLDGCGSEPKIDVISKDTDELRVTRTTYSRGKEGSEVVLITTEGGGHTWPGRTPPVAFLGKVANISANDLIWKFFKKHPMP